MHTKQNHSAAFSLKTFEEGKREFVEVAKASIFFKIIITNDFVQTWNMSSIWMKWTVYWNAHNASSNPTSYISHVTMWQLFHRRWAQLDFHWQEMNDTIPGLNLRVASCISITYFVQTWAVFGYNIKVSNCSWFKQNDHPIVINGIPGIRNAMPMHHTYVNTLMVASE